MAEKMPLRGYLKVSNPGVISTVASGDGEQTIRRRIEGTKLSSARTIYVTPCDHTGGVPPVAPVELFKLEGDSKEWVSLGIAKVCIFCWTIVRAPDGVELPTTARPVVDENGSENSRVSARLPRREKAVVKRTAGILEMMATRPHWTLIDLSEAVGMSRQGVRGHILELVDTGMIEIVQPGGRGRGKAAVYSLKKTP